MNRNDFFLIALRALKRNDVKDQGCLNFDLADQMNESAVIQTRCQHTSSCYFHTVEPIESSLFHYCHIWHQG